MGLTRRAPLQQRTPLKRGKPLRPRSNRPSATRLRRAYAEAKQRSIDYWGDYCIVPGCSGRNVDPHHAYPRQYRSLIAAWENIYPLCRGHHDLLHDGKLPWLRSALREVTDEMLLARGGAREYLRRPEVGLIIELHRKEETA